MKAAREISLAAFYGDSNMNVTRKIKEVSGKVSAIRLHSNGCFPGGGC